MRVCERVMIAHHRQFKVNIFTNVKKIEFDVLKLKYETTYVHLFGCWKK